MKPTLGGICALLILIVTTLLLRYAGYQQESLVNIAPVAAMALCFGLFYRQIGLAIVLAVVTLLASDAMIAALAVQRDPTLSFWGLLFSPTILLRYLVYGGILAIAWRLSRKHRSSVAALSLTPCVSLGFYGIMNTVAWALSAPPYAYAKTLAGWWQCQTVGMAIPGAPPSYVFLRNALIGDGLFTLGFLALMVWMPSHLAKRSPHDPSASSLKGTNSVA